MGSVTMTRFLMLVFLCFFLLQVTHQHPSKWKLVEMDSDELDDEGETGDTGAKDDLDDLAEAEQAPGNIAQEEKRRPSQRKMRIIGTQIGTRSLRLLVVI